MKYVDVNIKKPIYGTYCGVRETYIWKAKREGKKLRITIPQGVEIVSPDKWLKTAERIEKVFLRPDEPMVLYCNHVHPEKIDQPDERHQTMIASSVWERLRELGVEKNFR